MIYYNIGNIIYKNGEKRSGWCWCESSDMSHYSDDVILLILADFSSGHCDELIEYDGNHSKHDLLNKQLQLFFEYLFVLFPEL